MNVKPLILVVDDEEIERKMIIHILRHELCADYEVAEASNGLEAIEMVKKSPPHIIIMDIRMPLMNGFTALKEIFRICPDVSPVILTAHDEFEYAVQAIKIGVEDYILKPVRGVKLLDAIAKIEEKRNTVIQRGENVWKQQFDFFTPYIEDSVISAVVMDSYSPEKMKSIIQRIFSGNGPLFLIAIDNGKMSFDAKKTYEDIRSVLYAQDIKVIGSHLGRQIVLLIQLMQESMDTVLHMIENCLQEKGSIKCFPVEDPSECAMVYRRMNFEELPRDSERISDSFFCDEKGIAIKIAIQERDAAVSWIEELLIHQSNLAAPNDPVNRRMESRRTIIDHYLEMTVGAIQLSPVKSFEEYEDIGKLKTALKSYVDRRCRDVLEGQSHKLFDMLNTVIHDIEKNYMDGFYSLSRAADNLGISAAYLSKIFKEQLGSTFTKYLNDVRIDEAKRMLQYEMDIADISEKCGFNSPNYFCKVFKKYTGISAGSYRDTLVNVKEKKQSSKQVNGEET